MTAIRYRSRAKFLRDNTARLNGLLRKGYSWRLVNAEVAVVRDATKEKLVSYFWTKVTHADGEIRFSYFRGIVETLEKHNYWEVIND